MTLTSRSATAPGGCLGKWALLAWALIAVTPVCWAGALSPKSPVVQAGLAEAMAANQDWEEATRRWIDVLSYFGPSELEARGDFEIGAIALRRGRLDVAAARWQKTVVRYPGSEWAARAAQALRLLGREVPAAGDKPASTYVTADTPEDERQFLAAAMDRETGLLDFAIRDYLKVTNLYPESPRRAAARYEIGLCHAMAGRPELALSQWEQLLQDHPQSPEAEEAKAHMASWLALLDTAGKRSSELTGAVVDAGWRPFRSYDTEPDRGLSYAEDLYENGIYEYALQEYVKVLCDIYPAGSGGNPHKPYARYRMGVCAYRLGNATVAARQWRRLLADYPESRWAELAKQALAALEASDILSSEAMEPAQPVPAELPASLEQRYHMAEQLLDCGLPLVASKEYLKILLVVTPGRPNPYQAEAAYKVGRCHHLMGNDKLAIEVWRRAAADYPETEWGRRARDTAEAAPAREAVLGRSQEAAQAPGVQPERELRP